ncbi:Crp/Fnr family transcriptional regulator [Parapedobacter koreensis]|uniref:cAMP-binding domain of CRP or a regulatory subunit of cAMP-dependent protein kinases n=1 Tax=Parapedobacter koreensis TaxID=332977 RepID=A0A1H7QQB6_9SPHI|nr:Crp/Fnr family transcriptional regulator [Parapedobacter koreensis]SEL50099.1 cAMP-binding domain of CRP or a regulatory subunit of cAMP-dependent protein kinases [Parapedobacter koreensis]
MVKKNPEAPVQVLLRAIQMHHVLAAQEAQVIASYFKQASFSRKSSLLQAGETAHRLYFVVSGILHMYYADERGQQHSCNFFMPGELATDLESFSKQIPASNTIEALANAECLSISCKETVSLMQESPAFNKYVMDVVEAIAMQNINRTKDLLSLQPESRYQKLMATRPDIVRTVPQKYIARFLGISPESLSRIRSRMATSQTSY